MQNRKGSILEVVISDGQGDLSLTFFNQAWRVKDLRPGRRGIFAGQGGGVPRGEAARPSRLRALRRRGDGAPDGRGEREPADPDLSRDEHDRELAVHEDRRARARRPRSRARPAAREPARAARPARRPHRDRADPPARLRGPDRAGARRRCACTRRSCCRSRCCSSARSCVRCRRPAGRRARSSSASTRRCRSRARPTRSSVGDQIARDLEGDWPMNRLVQGEVGSGKTLVALRAMLQVAESGGQSALIAPTEVLAGQHLRSIARMLGPQLAPELMPTLLTGQLPAAERRKAALRDGIRAGAHRRRNARAAERHDDVRRPRTRRRRRAAPVRRRAARVAAREGLVAARARAHRDADPAHRRDDGLRRPRRLDDPHHARGAGRHPDLRRAARREARLVRAGLGPHRRRGRAGPAGVRRLRRDRRRRLAQGRHRRRARRDVEGEAPRSRWGVVQVADLLSRHAAFTDIRVEILHGRMPSDEKDAVMQAFARGDIDVLVATTVVEVGVDVPNASTMAILEADRFGVSQLHQLRGRVGRGGVPGLCLLVTEAPPGSPARQRVEAVAATLDGFELAEVDLDAARRGRRARRRAVGRAIVAAAAPGREGCRPHRRGAGRGRAAARRGPRAARGIPASPRRSSAASAWRSGRPSPRTDAARSRR